MKTALGTRFARTLLLFASLTAKGQFLANVVHEAYAAKATMTSLRSEVFYSRFARLETKKIGRFARSNLI